MLKIKQVETNLDVLIARAYDYAANKHKFWPEDQEGRKAILPQQLCLVHEEISEALKEWRKDPHFPEMRYAEDGKPEGFPSELADVCLRIFSIAGALEVDLPRAIQEVSDYSWNKRPYKHGDVR